MSERSQMLLGRSLSEFFQVSEECPVKAGTGPHAPGGPVPMPVPERIKAEARPTPAGKPVTHSYPVADLVTPFPAFSAGPGELPPLGTFHTADTPEPVRPVSFTLAAPDAARPVIAANARALCTLVTTIVHPYTWATNGGTGTVTYDPPTHSLVVSNTEAVQAEVSEFVVALRRLQERGCGCQVALEVRVLEVPVPTVERAGIECQPPGAGCCEGKEPPAAAACLTDAQVRTLLTYALEDRGANVLTAPKMTCMDGQRGTFQLCQTETFQTGLELSAGPGGVARKPKYEAVDLGLRLAAKPTVSADRRFVRVELRYEAAGLRTPAVPQVPVTTGGGGPADFLSLPAIERHAVDLTLALPDGGTAVVPGPVVVREVRHEDGTPVLSRIPYMNRLFTTVGITHVPVRQLLLVTPRVIRAEGEEERPAAGCPKCPGGPRALTAVVATTVCSGSCDGPAAAAGPAAAELVAAYRKACAEGRTEAATALAVRALAIDPACFAGPAGGCGKK